MTTAFHLASARARAATIATALAAALLGAPAATADPISAEPLTVRHSFADPVSMTIRQTIEGLEPQVVEIEDASHLVIVEFRIQPGAVFPWHTHPGTVLISITEGDFVFVFAEDCVERGYTAGSALVDPGNTVHTALNPSADDETVVIATLLGAPADGGLTIPVEEAEAAALDDRCGIDTPGAHAH